jgi:hypothetical protein
MIEVANLNGFGIKRSRILNNFGNVKGHLIILAPDVLTKAYPILKRLADS